MPFIQYLRCHHFFVKIMFRCYCTIKYNRLFRKQEFVRIARYKIRLDGVSQSTKKKKKRQNPVLLQFPSEGGRVGASRDHFAPSKQKESRSLQLQALKDQFPNV